MTKNYWAGVVIFSAMICVAANLYVTRTLEERFTKDVPLQTFTQPPEPTKELVTEDPVVEIDDLTDDTPKSQSSKNNDVELQKSDIEIKPPVKKEVLKEVPNQKSSQVRNIGFVFHSSNANSVAIIGDFNNWNRQNLTKEGVKNWSIALKIEPGTYEYLYLVDDKRVKDPFNSKVSKGGKSLLVVKPLTK